MACNWAALADSVPASLDSNGPTRQMLPRPPLLSMPVSFVIMGLDPLTGAPVALQRIALKNRFYGYRRIEKQLRREGFCVNHKRVQRLMRLDNLLCLRKRPFVPVTTNSTHEWPVVPNLAPFMRPGALDQLWVADITYVRLLDEFAYLAIVLDAFSRRVVGWELDDHHGAAQCQRLMKTAGAIAHANSSQ